MTSPSRPAATARAHPNIALVKYWGKADTALNLPATGSLSMTLDIFPTTTTVAVDPALDRDVFELDGRRRDGVPAERVSRFLDIVRGLAGTEDRAVVRSTNAVPSAAGLASSASGFAALAGAAAAAYGLTLDAAALSRLARRGSGSAARSITGGFAVWHAGDDAASFAREIPAPELSMVIATVERTEKPVSSREAMGRTLLTSPFYPAWVASTAETLDAALEAFEARDIERIGRITETNALRMHAVIQACDPPIRYLRPASIAIFDRVEKLRADGVPAYATADAGPNVVVLCRPADIPVVVAGLDGMADLEVAHPGPGMSLLAPDEAVEPAP